MAHNVTVENTFSGPMDLLLYLVRRDEIDIHDIPVSHLTREYLAELDKLEFVDVDAGGEFVAMASLLTELKSRMLLPVAPEDESAEDEESFDPRTGLVRALLEYKRFKEVAAELEAKAREHLNRFSRCAPPPEFSYIIRGGAQELGALDLFAAFQKIARKYLNESRPREIINEEVATEVRIAQIEELLRQRPRVSFTSLLSDNPTRDEMVGFFIAMLELIRLRKIRAQQSIDFSEIYFFTRQPGEELPPPEKEPEAAPASVQSGLTRASGRPLPLRFAPVFAPVRALASPVRPAQTVRLKTGSGFLPLRPVAAGAGAGSVAPVRRSVAAVFAPVRTSPVKPVASIAPRQPSMPAVIAAAEINPSCTDARVNVSASLPTCRVVKPVRPLALRLAGITGGAVGGGARKVQARGAGLRGGVIGLFPRGGAGVRAGGGGRLGFTLFPAATGGRIMRAGLAGKAGLAAGLFPCGAVPRVGGKVAAACVQVVTRLTPVAPQAEIKPVSEAVCVDAVVQPAVLASAGAGAKMVRVFPRGGGSLADPFTRRAPVMAAEKKTTASGGIFPQMRSAARLCAPGRGARKFRLF